MRFPWTKSVPVPVTGIDQQLAVALKSISLPAATPKWSLFSKGQPDWSETVAIREGYNASAIVYACVEKRAKLLASIPWRAMNNGEHMPDSPLQRLIDNPNPDQSCYEFVYAISQSLDLSGNAFISEIKGGMGGLPFELWPLPSQHMKIKAGSVRLVERYEYCENGVKAIIQPEDMIQLKMPNPNSRWFGMPVLMAAGRATDIDREAGIWQKVSLQNRGVLDVHIQVPEGTTPEQAQSIKDKWRERQSGPSNARAPVVTSGDVKHLGQSAAELDFVASRRAVWTEIAAVFGVPLAAIGFTEDVNLANAGAMMRQLWQTTTVPQLELIRRQLNSQLVSEFGPEWELVPDLSNVQALQENLSDKLASAERLQKLGYTRNEINDRLELGFENDEETGNIRYEPSGLLPIGMDDMTTPDEKAAASKLTYG